MNTHILQMLAVTPIGLTQIDLEGRLLFADGRLLRDLGLDPPNLIGASSLDLFAHLPMFDGGGNPLTMTRVLERVRAGDSFITTTQMGGRWLETCYEPTRAKPDEVSGSFAVTTDVTERNLLRTERHRFFTMTQDLLCIAGMDGYFKMVNPSFERVLGYSTTELTSRKFLDFVHPDDLAITLAEIDKLRTGATTLNFDNRYVARDGAVHNLSWTSVPDVAAGVLYATARDITETKKLRASLALNDRLAAVGSLAAGVAHEINNPLAFVVANLAYVVSELSNVADIQGCDLKEIRVALRDAQDGTDRVRRITKDLKVFARGNENRVSAVDVRQVIESSISMAWNEIRHSARLVKSFTAVPTVDANESRLGQVILNLLINAAQAIPAGAADRNVIEIATRQEGSRVVIEISDTGSGISPQSMKRLFEPFFTTKPMGVGTGLGLSICHGIVTGFGGTIAATSEPGKSTMFRISLPVGGTLPEAPPIATSASGQHRVRASILAIDDEPLLISAYQRMLGAKHSLTTETDARRAWARIERGEQFDVIFCDVMMPMMTGDEFYTLVKARDPELAERIVFVTGGAFSVATREFLERVNNLRIEKPFDMSAISAIVHDRVKTTAS